MPDDDAPEPTDEIAVPVVAPAVVADAPAATGAVVGRPAGGPVGGRPADGGPSGGPADGRPSGPAGGRSTGAGTGGATRRRSSPLVKAVPRPTRSAGGGMSFRRPTPAPAPDPADGTPTARSTPAERSAPGRPAAPIGRAAPAGAPAPGQAPVGRGEPTVTAEPVDIAAPEDAGPAAEPIGRRGGGLLSSAAPAGGGGPLRRTPERTLTGPAGQVLETESVGSTVRIFRVGKPAGLTFTAGQYLKVGLPGARRGSFTIASAPHDAHLELCIELIPGGRLTPRMFATAAGGRLDVSDAAKGSFVLDTSGTTHLMVATVTGIAPLRSMLRDALHRGTRDRFVVLHGASYRDELPYMDELTELAATDERVTYTPTVSRPGEPRNAGWRGATGRVETLATEVVGTLPGATTRAYACGNPGMIANVSKELRQRGLKVLTEKFD